MSPFLKIRIKGRLAGLFPALYDMYEGLDLARTSAKWRSCGWALPAHPLIKRSILLAEARRINATTFVETGTYQGDTVWFLRKKIPNIVSVEVQPTLASLAKARFRRWPNVKIVEGDSGDVLSTVCSSMEGPVLFWLDGHYSGGFTGSGREECPLWRELEAITRLKSGPWSVFIDDARTFGVDPAYPTIAEVESYAARNCPGHGFSVENDMIKISAIQG